MSLRALLVFFVLSLTACSSVSYQPSSNEVIEEDPGSRTMGEVIDDNTIESKIKSALHQADERFNKARVRVISHNGKVLLVGQVQDSDMLELATEIARQVRKVKSVHNEMSVGDKISASVRANDSWLTVKVRSRMFTTDNFPSRKVNVITENGVIYLMGIVSKSVAQQAAELATEVNGVQRVVTLFEYLEDQ